MSGKVSKVLNDRLMAQLVTGDVTTSHVGLENDDFDPEANNVDFFFRTNTILSRPRLIGAFASGSGSYRVEGEYRIIVAVKKGSGSVAGGVRADTVKALFPRGLELLTDDGIKVKIEETYKQTGVPSGAFFHIPVSVIFWFYEPYQP